MAGKHWDEHYEGELTGPVPPPPRFWEIWKAREKPKTYDWYATNTNDPGNGAPRTPEILAVVKGGKLYRQEFGANGYAGSILEYGGSSDAPYGPVPEAERREVADLFDAALKAYRALADERHPPAAIAAPAGPPAPPARKGYLEGELAAPEPKLPPQREFWKTAKRPQNWEWLAGNADEPGDAARQAPENLVLTRDGKIYRREFGADGKPGPILKHDWVSRFISVQESERAEVEQAFADALTAYRAQVRDRLPSAPQPAKGAEPAVAAVAPPVPPVLPVRSVETEPGLAAAAPPHSATPAAPEPSPRPKAALMAAAAPPERASPAAAEPETVLQSFTIKFSEGSTRLSRSGKRRMWQVAEKIKQALGHGQHAVLKLTGTADRRESGASNEKFAARRAGVVDAELRKDLKKLRVEPGQVSIATARPFDQKEPSIRGELTLSH
jgi:outer membrane protein OmpA-like peptidoglycan-associated protein